MSFDAFAVATRWGPHVTLQAGVVHLGRHWTTTARRSAKARAARRSGRAAATTVGRDGALHIVAGAVRVLDGSRPGSLLADPFTVGLAPGALARLAFGQLSQVLGYAEAATAVPVGWLPLGRVVLVTEISDE
ncbi:MAG TPA: hypothetical protein VFP61_09300, partial [Acidimicrobiales bacterium]|nr:hypothetical protein [Acidimicrobiales bacterium]